ncbi:MAG: SMC-Scp complex subunit ScpB [Candidatus Melainabacteria bacterium]
MGLKQEIEVILFWKNKPIALSSIADTLDVNPAEAKKAIMDLIREYELKDGGLQVSFRESGYVLEPKDEYASLAQKFLPINLKMGALRTLALIALREPIKQTTIIHLRGSGAYDHIRDLAEAHWIIKEPIGSTYTVSTTKEFKKYFRFSEEGSDMKKKLMQILKASEIEENQKELDLDGLQDKLLGIDGSEMNHAENTNPEHIELTNIKNSESQEKENQFSLMESNNSLNPSEEKTNSETTESESLLEENVQILV